MEDWSFDKCCVIVAHPDDETLWCGGLMLLHSETSWKVACLCRREDSERAVKFRRVMKVYGASFEMGEMDDGPDLMPLGDGDVSSFVRKLVGDKSYDLIITHGPKGEYTRHIRHEEVSRAVVGMWRKGELTSEQLWMFAYSDRGGSMAPRAETDADIIVPLGDTVLAKKEALVQQYYGFASTSFEARAVSSPEAFWRVSK